MPEIHPTATVDESAQIADDVRIGPYCIVEGDTSIASGTVLRDHAIVRRYTRIGENNFIDAHTVLGGEPQDLKFDPQTVSYLNIGDDNVFRECVTISRGSNADSPTTVGNGTYWMACSHAGHDATIGDGAILINTAAVGGHATIGPRAILSASVIIHQFCWVGEMVMSQGHAGTSCHVPPYTMFAEVNKLIGLNTVGLRRAPDISDEDRKQIKEAFNLTYRSGLTPSVALEKMDACTDFGEAAGKFREFIRAVVNAEPPYKHPLPRLRSRSD
ncbi:MAG: acyl-ACP--UDP-N-acetylglucosamine O-acyltransferase [Planctomycetota bacterium]